MSYHRMWQGGELGRGANCLVIEAKGEGDNRLTATTQSGLVPDDTRCDAREVEEDLMCHTSMH